MSEHRQHSESQLQELSLFNKEPIIRSSLLLTCKTRPNEVPGLCSGQKMQEVYPTAGNMLDTPHVLTDQLMKLSEPRLQVIC